VFAPANGNAARFHFVRRSARTVERALVAVDRKKHSPTTPREGFYRTAAARDDVVCQSSTSKRRTKMGGRKMLSFGAAGFIGMMLAGLSAMPVHGQSPTQPVTVTAQRTAALTERVPFGDLSLATKDGQRTLYRRVRYAIDRVCPDSDYYLGTYDVAGCKDFAWSGAKPQIDRALTAAAGGASLTMAIEVTGARSD